MVSGTWEVSKLRPFWRPYFCRELQRSGYVIAAGCTCRPVKKSYADLGTVAGTVTLEKKPKAELFLDINQNDKLVSSVKTDDTGQYHLKLVAGDYTLKVPGGQGVKKTEVTGITVNAGQETHTYLALLPIKLPEILEKTASAYKALHSYRDTTIIETKTVISGMDNQMNIPFLFAFEKPNKLRIASLEDSPLGKGTMVSDGKKVFEYVGMWNQYMELEAPEIISDYKSRGPTTGMAESMLVKNLITT